MNYPYPTTPYKYKVDQSIVYTETRYEEKECDCCGNIEEEAVEHEVRASIKSRRRVTPDNYYTPQSFRTELIHDKIINKDGSTTVTPRYPTLEEELASKRMFNQYTLSNKKVILERLI